MARFAGPALYLLSPVRVRWGLYLDYATMPGSWNIRSGGTSCWSERRSYEIRKKWFQVA